MLARTQTRFHAIRLRLENYDPRTRAGRLLWEFFVFGFKQAWASLFGAILLLLILGTQWLWPRDEALSRYDFLLLSALALQTLMLLLRLETLREAKIILLFHLIGTLMELFKTDMGSWTYPEESVFRLGHVPLFSGFMYAAVGSYLARVTRILDLHFTAYPRRRFTVLLASAVYVNFFTHHYLPDARPFLFAFAWLLFGPVWVTYRVCRIWRKMPLVLGFSLVTLFIWLAGNIGTGAHAWIYPHQAHGWTLVRFGKYGSWFLLMIISFVLVSFVHPPRAPPFAIPAASLFRRQGSSGHRSIWQVLLPPPIFARADRPRHLSARDR